MFRITRIHRQGAILNIFKYFVIILVVSTNYMFVHLLDNKVFESSLMHGTNTKRISKCFSSMLPP